MQNFYSVILAPNPSIMTGPGTNTIVLGEGSEGATVIDPAVNDPDYLEALFKEGAKRGGIRRILITHGHHDHIDGAAALQERLEKQSAGEPGSAGARIYAFSRAGVPIADEEIADGTTFPAGDDTLRAIYTPGHRFDHLCYFLEGRGTLFAGDIVAGVGTVVIIPSEGDMQDYLDSLMRLQEMDISEIVPAHGPLIEEPRAKLDEYIAHRKLREEQILQALEGLPRGVTISEVVRQVYTDVDPRMHAVAAWSVEAHLIKLEREGEVEKLEPGGWALTMPTA
jgi:glyoxylase-like metal-dependent hydrolase (beta-lactamase superfamily II)